MSVFVLTNISFTPDALVLTTGRGEIVRVQGVQGIGEIRFRAHDGSGSGGGAAGIGTRGRSCLDG